MKHCDQIGILKEETPTLYLDKQEYSALRKAGGSRAVRDSRYGECNHEQHAIFVNARTREYQIKQYLTEIGSKRTGIRAHLRYVKPTYRHYLHTLVHELVHYRFESMPHGFKFENRIKEILKGRTFEQKSVVGKEEEDKGFKWRLNGITRVPKLSIEERIKTVRTSAEFLYKQHAAEGKTVADILPELKSRYMKYIDEKEIEAGFNQFIQEKKE